MGKHLAIALFLLTSIAPAMAQEEYELEEIIVIGVRSSIEKSLDAKRNAEGIQDVITAEDIGQLPDENIAEALQRVTGIQMSRNSEGEGETIQIRGISDNNVQINGQEFIGTVANRSINFNDIPSELFSGIEVLKTPSASQIEGSLGGTVNLKTRRPLQVNNDKLGSITIKGRYSDITEPENKHPAANFPDINLLTLRNFRDTKIGDIGFLLNLSRKFIITRSDSFGGGDFGSAPASWYRYNGLSTPNGAAYGPNPAGKVHLWGANTTVKGNKKKNLNHYLDANPSQQGDYKTLPDYFTARWAKWQLDTGPLPNAATLGEFYPEVTDPKVPNGIALKAQGTFDPNGDGALNNKDIWYAPGGFTSRSRYSETTNYSLNSSLQWQPTQSLNLFMDYTMIRAEQDRWGSQFAVTIERELALPLINHPDSGEDYYYPYHIAPLADTERLGQTYLLNAATIIGTNVVFGGAPSLQETNRRTDNITFGGDWQALERLKLFYQFNYGRGVSVNNQVAMTMSHDFDRDGEFAGDSDDLGVLSYDRRGVDLVDLLYRPSPYFVPSGEQWPGAPQVETAKGASGLNSMAFDPRDLTYPRLAYLQLKRQATDRINETLSNRLDVKYRPKSGFNFFRNISFGVRQAQRNFYRRAWSDSNQGIGSSLVLPAEVSEPTQPNRADFSSDADYEAAQTQYDSDLAAYQTYLTALEAYNTRLAFIKDLYLDEDGDGRVKRVYIRDIRVNPASNYDAEGTIDEEDNFSDEYLSDGTFLATYPRDGEGNYILPPPSAAKRAAIAEQLLRDCIATAHTQFKGLSGNFPLSWPRTSCGMGYYTDFFNLYDIRHKGADGIGIYEERREFYEITEDIYNAYLQADFNRQIFGKRLFGNMGVRYVYAEVNSKGFAPLEQGGHVEQSFTGRKEDFLPSLNANLWLSKNMILRLGISRSLNRPAVGALSPTISNIDYTNLTATIGNPSLRPVRSNNIDLSYEYYYRKNSLFALAVFHKNIDSTITFKTNQRTELIGGVPFRVNSQINKEGTEIQGIELALQHVMQGKGVWGNIGFGFNYTFSDEDTDLFDQEGDPIPRVRLSENSYNASIFYDDGKLSIRLAYNWRDDFVRRSSVALGFGRAERLPEWEKGRAQLDISINYRFNPNLKLNISGVNINRSRTVRYMKYEQLQNYLAQSGARYTISIVQRF